MKKTKISAKAILHEAAKAGRSQGRSASAVAKDATLRAKSPKKSGDKRAQHSDVPVKVKGSTFFI